MNKMDTSDPVPFLLVTANVGSVFEDVSTVWILINMKHIFIIKSYYKIIMTVSSFFLN